MYLFCLYNRRIIESRILKMENNPFSVQIKKKKSEPSGVLLDVEPTFF